MSVIETEIDIDRLKKSGKRGTDLLKFAYEVLQYDGVKLLHVAIMTGAPHVNHILAASMLGYSPATMRNWHSQSNGPIDCKMVNGKPFWRIRDIRRLLGE